MKTFLRSVIVAISCAVSLLGQTPRTKLPVYVGPQTRDGFVDVDRGILDSIKDIKNALRGSRPFRVVERPEEATILLTVVARRVPGTAGSVGAPVGGMAVFLPIQRRAIDTLLRVGEYEKAITGEDEDHDAWGAAAKNVVRDVTAWFEANRSLLEAQPAAR